MKHEAIGHPKMHDLAGHINQPLYAAHGILEMLWHHAGDYAPDGNIGKLSDSAIARAVDWQGDPTILIVALVESRWLDRHEHQRLLIHDWQEHAQEWVKKKLRRIQKKKAFEEIDWHFYPNPSSHRPATVQPPSSHRPAESSLTDTETGKNDLSSQCPASVQTNPHARGLSLAKGGEGSSSTSGTQHKPSRNGVMENGARNGVGDLGAFEVKPLADKLWHIHPSPSQFGSVEQALAEEIKNSAMPSEIFAAKITASMEAWAAYWLTEKRHATGLVKWISDGDYSRQPPIKKRAPQPDAPETAAQVLEREARQNEADEAARIARRAKQASQKETTA